VGPVVSADCANEYYLLMRSNDKIQQPLLECKYYTLMGSNDKILQPLLECKYYLLVGSNDKIQQLCLNARTVQCLLILRPSINTYVSVQSTTSLQVG
jgi:hypothetical protein